MFLSAFQGEEEGDRCPSLRLAYVDWIIYISVRCVSIFQTAGCACFVTIFLLNFSSCDWWASSFSSVKENVSAAGNVMNWHLAARMGTIFPTPVVLAGPSRSHQELLSLLFALWYPVEVVKLDEMSKSMGFPLEKIHAVQLPSTYRVPLTLTY